jgi:hypothetical protein
MNAMTPRAGRILAALVSLAAVTGCTLVSPEPVADFDVMPVVLYAGEAVTLDASVASGDIVDYEWSLGSGATESGREVVTTFAAPGVYVVELTVRDREGRTDTDAQELTVYVRSGTKLFSEDFSDGDAALGRWATDPTLVAEDESSIAHLSSENVGYCLYVHSSAERLHRRGAAVEIPPLRVGQRLTFSVRVMAAQSHAGYGFVIAPGRSRFSLPVTGLPYYVYSGSSGTSAMREPVACGDEIARPVAFKPSLYQWHTYTLAYSADGYTLSVDGAVVFTGFVEGDLSTGGTWWIALGDESETEACKTYYDAVSVMVEE